MYTYSVCIDTVREGKGGGSHTHTHTHTHTHIYIYRVNPIQWGGRGRRLTTHSAPPMASEWPAKYFVVECLRPTRNEIRGLTRVLACAYACACVHVCVRVRTCVCMRVCVCVLVYTYTRAYIYTYTYYTHIYIRARKGCQFGLTLNPGLTYKLV